MKKITLLMAVFFLFSGTVFSQGVDDRAVVPVAVTLNSILRLNVTSGGNIEFNFNTLNDYTHGIETSAAYQTKFNVASSVNWEVLMYAEDAHLVGTDVISAGTGDDAVAANNMDINNIGYHVSVEGTIGASVYINGAGDAVALTSSESEVLVGYNGITSNAGDIHQNNFTIHWRCGTTEGNMNQTTILSQAIAADRYATNVFLTLQPSAGPPVVED